jgi:hypothetical protein
MAKAENQFTFEISLSVLNHLGRNLYRSFITVLGEAISNAWDADAENVWIYIDHKKNSLVVKDDGDGMTADDFQNKFLKIGYSKRKDGSTSTKKQRPYIGRKGIGKLALLSCARRISVLTRKSNTDYVGGVIDNTGLSEAIKHDLTPDEYPLGKIQDEPFRKYTKGHKHGTIIYFEDINEGIRNSTEYLKKLIALYFRFSLVDDSFNILVDGEKITLDYLDDLARKTQFLWDINGIDDPYLTNKLLKVQNLKESRRLKTNDAIRGFIASVETPRDLKVIATDEKISVDLFVNGRLREKDILKHIPTARLVENYLYGQIHFDQLDDGVDRFTSSREGVVADDPKFKELLESLKRILVEVIDDWDKWRIKHKKDGDPDNPRLSKKERKSSELFNVVSDDYSLPRDSPNKKKVDAWVDSLAEDARFNFSSYAECYISENLIRKYVEEQKIPLSPEAKKEADQWKQKESDNKNKGNISIDIRQSSSDLSYLSMDHLANLVDKAKDAIREARLSRDANEYKPIRDALAHTALLTDVAKNKLTTVYENIKGRVRTLLSGQ